jgi:hypothetical protein
MEIHSYCIPSKIKNRTIFFDLEPMARSLMAAFISRKHTHTHGSSNGIVGISWFAIFNAHNKMRKGLYTKKN